MRRLIVCNGPWHIALVTAALRDSPSAEDHLYLYAPGDSAEFRAAVEHLASIAHKWASVTWDTALSSAAFTSQSIAAHQRRIADGVGRTSWDEVWVCKLHERQEKLILSALGHQLPIVLLEDGLTAYFPMAWHEPLMPTSLGECKDAIGVAVRRTRQLLGERASITNWGVYRRHVERIKECRLVLSGELPLPDALRRKKQRPIRCENLRQTLADLGDAVMRDIELPPEGPPGRKALLLGQYLHHHGGIGYQEELKMYGTAARELSEAGYTVYWKNHPRFTHDIAAEINRAPGGSLVVDYPYPAKWPVEFFSHRFQANLCVSYSSSSLIYLNLLYGTERRSLIGWVKAGNSTMRQMARLLDGRVEAMPLPGRETPVASARAT